MGWQPIETAPKDRVIDLWSSRGYRVPDCIWDVVKYATEPSFSDEVQGWTDANSHGSVMKAAPFTHWMPKPEAPQ